MSDRERGRGAVSRWGAAGILCYGQVRVRRRVVGGEASQFFRGVLHSNRTLTRSG